MDASELRTTYRRIIEETAGIFDSAAPEFQEDGLCAYEVKGYGHLEFAPCEGETAFVVFFEVRRETSDSVQDWKTYLELNFALSNPHGIFLARNPKDEAIYLVRHFDVETTRPAMVAEVVAEMLKAWNVLNGDEFRKEMEKHDDDGGGGGDSFARIFPGSLV